MYGEREPPEPRSGSGSYKNFGNGSTLVLNKLDTYTW